MKTRKLVTGLVIAIVTRAVAAPAVATERCSRSGTLSYPEKISEAPALPGVYGISTSWTTASMPA